ncbi:MAG: TonB-dependent receptor [Pseudomonadota bacterium]
MKLIIMGKPVMLSMAIIGLMHTPLSLAENNAEVIEVTSSRVLQSQSEALAAIDVFEREEIEKIQPRSLAELLQRVAGVTKITQGTEAHNTDLFFRGSNSDHVLILIDGMRVGSATVGVKSTSSLSVDQIERVEVVRGPRASLWGSDAIGGVIQIFTRQFRQQEGYVKAGLGSNAYWGVSGGFGIGDKEGISVTFSSESSDGFDVIRPDLSNPFAVDQPDDDGYERQSFTFHGQKYLSDIWRSQLSGQWDQGNVEFDSGFGGDETDYRNGFVHWTNQIDMGVSRLEFSAGFSQDRDEDNADEIVPGSSTSLFKTDRTQLNLVNHFSIQSHVDVSVGVDWYLESIETRDQYSETEREVSALFGIMQYQRQQLQIEASLRYDDVEGIDEEFTYHASLGFFTTKNMLMTLSHARGFKAPTFNDLYFPEAFGSMGNPDLVSEIADNSEFLIRYLHPFFELESSVYFTEYDNLITWSSNPDTGVFQPINIDKAEVFGTDLTLRLASYELTHELTLSHQDAKDKNSDQQLIRRPYFTAFYNVSMNWEEVWYGALEFEHHGRQSDVGDITISARNLMNAIASYEGFQDWLLSIKINNLFDKDYFVIDQYPGAGREYRATLEYRF